jgi:ankyrin repeat protein
VRGRYTTALKMSTTAPMFLELDQEERERELEQLEQIAEEDERNKQPVDTLPDEVIKSRENEQYQRTGKRCLLAAEKGQLLELVNYIHSRPSVVNFADNDGYTPLHRASYGGHIDCVKYLVRHGADIEAKTNDDWRPLHCAVRWNNVEVAEFLVKYGADINAKSSGGNTPLHIVASNGRYSLTCDIIQMLLFHPDCDFDCKNQSGDTAFDIAKRSGPFYKLWSGVVTLLPDGSRMPDDDDGE